MNVLVICTDGADELNSVGVVAKVFDLGGGDVEGGELVIVAGKVLEVGVGTEVELGQLVAAAVELLKGVVLAEVEGGELVVFAVKLL